MKRTFATTTLAVALFGATACKGGAGDAVKLVPDSATVIGGVDVKGATSSKLYTETLKPLIEEGETKEGMDAAKACNLGLDKWKTITFGADPKGGDAVVVVLTADGIGKKENLECVAGKLKEQTQKDPFTIEEKDGKLTLGMADDEGTGWVLDDNTLVVAGKDWVAPVKELIDGKGKPAVDNTLKAVYGRADTKKSMWFAGVVPADMTAGTPAEGAKEASGWVDVSSGVSIAADVLFGTAEEATAKAKELNEQFTQMKGLASGMGVPQGIVDSVKIEAKDANVHVEAKASEEDVKSASEAVNRQKQGGGAPPAAPEPAAEEAPAAEAPPAE